MAGRTNGQSNTPLPLCYYVPLDAIVLCLDANCSTKDDVIKIFLTNDLVKVFFRVVNLNYSGSVADVRICGRKDLWWLAVMLGPVIHQILFSRSPIKSILVLHLTAMQPVELHIHGLQRLRQNFVGE